MFNFQEPTDDQHAEAEEDQEEKVAGHRGQDQEGQVVAGHQDQRSSSALLLILSQLSLPIVC